MIDWRRATTAERTVLFLALRAYHATMQRKAETHSSAAVRNRAQWQAYEAERMAAEIDGR